MTTRIIASCLMGMAALSLAALAWRNWRWHAAQILQFAVIGLAALVAYVFTEPVWASIAVTLYLVVALVPQTCRTWAGRWRLQERWREAAQARQLAGFALGGAPGRLERGIAAALRAMANHDLARAEQMLDALVRGPIPAFARGEAWLVKLQLRAQFRQWPAVIDLYEGVPHWGSPRLANQAALTAARAYAELTDFARSLQCLEKIAYSPWGLMLEEDYWAARVRLAAMAGDTAELENLLARRTRPRRGRARFVAYWQGRCALRRGDRVAAVRGLTRAHTLTLPQDRFWQEAIQHYLVQAESAGALPPAAVDSTDYRAGLAALHEAERIGTPWNHMVALRHGEPVALGLLGGLVIICLVLNLMPVSGCVPFVDWAGNSPVGIRTGEWWRLVTALLVHVEPAHMALNGLGLWIFGSAVVRLAGAWRMLVIFFVAGMAGNAVSAWLGHYDLAIGASTGLFALIGAYGVAGYRLRHPRFLVVRRRFLQLVALVVSADFVIGGLEAMVDNVAHISGFAWGIVVALVVGVPRTTGLQSGPRPTKREPHA